MIIYDNYINYITSSKIFIVLQVERKWYTWQEKCEITQISTNYTANFAFFSLLIFVIFLQQHQNLTQLLLKQKKQENHRTSKMLNIYTQQSRLLTFHLLIIILLIKLCDAASLFCNTTTNICQPCYYRCRTCKGTGQADCLQCMPEYVLANGECLACGMYCASCATETGDIWERFYMGALRCETCMAGYYLSQARGVCLNCPTGALQCTLSSIQTCKPGYSISNGICSPCPENCLSCPTSNPSACQQCSLGYYLSPSTSSSLNMFCTKCSIQNCENCDSAFNCVQCSSGYSGALCTQFAPCVSRCKICYLNQCLLCQTGFFVHQGLCLPLGVLCSQIGGSGLSDCGQCQPFAYLSQSKCLPYYSISDTQTQTYLTPSTLSLNSQATVSYINSTCVFKNLKINSLIQITTSSNKSTSNSVKNKLVVDIENQLPFFAFDAIVRLIVPENVNSFDFVTINGVQNEIGKDHLACVSQDQTKYKVVNLQFGVKMSQNFNLSSYSFTKNNHTRNGFSLTLQCPNCSSLGLSQLLIQFQHCMISQCQTCTSAYICKSCFYPYLLQDNTCIQQCSSGYYLTSQTGTCSYDCLNGYYPILEDYLCIACLVPCLRCWGNQSYQCYDCVDGWYFDAQYGTCVKVCGIGSYGIVGVTGAVCESCLYPCKSCQINNTRCTSCTTGYLVEASHYCSYTCPQKTYLSLLQICTPCISPCRQCLNQNQCLSCANPYYYLNTNNSCLLSCPIGTISINEICVFCQYPCFQCSVSVDNCKNCTVGFLEGFKCVEICSVGYYGDQIYNRCSLCSNFCLKCLNLATCLECKSPRYLFNNSCIQTCPLSTYPSDTSSTSANCIPCSPPCQTCVSKTQCLSCTNSLLIVFNYTCQSQCPPSTYMYLNSSNNISSCKLCVNGCTQCIGQNQCLKCSSGYLMIVGQYWCGILCPPGRFLWKEGEECVLCVSPCVECQSYYQCTSCADGYYYLAEQKQCYSECPLGYLVNTTSKTCQQCSPSCQKCSQKWNHCLECSSLNFRQPNSSFQQQNTLTFQCKINCPQTYYPQPILRACVPCEPPCRSCLTMKTCLTCLPSMPYLFNGQCLSDCPFGMFQHNLVCNQCDSSCLICSHSANNCTGCSRGLYLLQSSENQYQNGQCLTNCPSQFYPSSSHTCLACQPPCQTCLSETLCQSCQPPYLLFALNCLEFCPNEYYISINSSAAATCKVCNNQCSSCQYLANNCTSCFITNTYLLRGSGESNQCVFQCPDNMYMDNRLKICQVCGSSCKSCVEDGVCSSCQDGFVLVQFQCVNKCPDKYFINNSTCTRCEDPCLTCQTELSCTSCVKPYLYISNTLMSALSLSLSPCSQFCPNRTYPSSTSSSTLQCLLCPPSCLQCHDYSSCKSCNTTSNRPYLQQTSCLGYCSPGYYPQNSTFTCQECPQNCVSCQSNSKCYQCVNSYLHRGVCVTECGDGFYGDASGACLICVEPCDRCFDSSNCLSCKPTYYLYQTFCLKHCPSEMWSYPQSQGCHQHCNLPYRDSANKMCYKRCPKYYNSEGECVNQCTNLGQLQVLNSSLGCQRCHGSCPQTPYFKSYFVNFGDRHFIAVLFSVQVMGWQRFSKHYSFYVETQSQLLYEYLSIQNSLTTSASSVSNSRLLQVYYPTPTTKSPNMVLLQLTDPPVSPQLTLTISSYEQISYNSYPLQNKLVSMEVSSNYFTSHNYAWMTYFGQILGYIIMFLMAISLMLDNAKAIYGLVQVVQAAWVLRFLGIWWWVGFGEVMGGGGVSFKLGIKDISTAHIWDCGIKKILYFNYCDYQYNLISISIIVGIFVVMAFIGKLFFMKFSPDRHRLIWNHINNFYWYFAFLVFFAAYDAPTVIFAPIASLLGLLTILLWYQSIKNIFNNTYAESTFFFSLKKGKSPNPISNSVYPISLCRRLLLFLFISIDPSQQILILSLTTFATIFLIVNAMWNKPYKVYKILLPLNECLVGIFYFILEVFVVISKGVGKETWEVTGWAVTVLFLIIVVIGAGIGVRQNVRIVRKIWGKYRKKSSLQKDTKKQITQENKNKEVDHQQSTPKFNEKQLQNMGRKPALKSTPTQSPVSSHKKCSFPKQPSKQKQGNEKSKQQQLKLKSRNKNSNKNSNKDKDKDNINLKNRDRITEQIEQYEDEEVNSYFQSSQGQSNYSSSLSLGFTAKGAAKYLVKVTKIDGGVNGQGTAMF